MLLHQNSYTPLCFHIILLRFKNWEVSTSIDSSKNLTLRLMTVFPAGFIAEIKPFFTAAPEVARAIACWLHLKLASRVEYTPMTKPALMGLFLRLCMCACIPGLAKARVQHRRQLYYMTAQNDANMVNAIRYNAVVSCSSINSTI